jgi:pimeloyl-ACP methyl ester carboxylesterase
LKQGGGLVALGALALAGAAALVDSRAKRAEKMYPAKGRFVSAGGARLHYIEKGQGQPVVFLHGNGAMVHDLVISGIIERTALRYRAIAFDRLGFGHSDRPRERNWTAVAQASILPEAFKLLGIERPIVVGHSWGTLVALALGLDHPRSVSGLVLVSGYYYPTPRMDGVLAIPAATPMLGDLLNHTLTPFIGEAIAPRLIDKMFSPQGVSPKFTKEFPVALTLRPSQIKAFAEDASHMVAAAEALSPRYNRFSRQQPFLPAMRTRSSVTVRRNDCTARLPAAGSISSPGAVTWCTTSPRSGSCAQSTWC